MNEKKAKEKFNRGEKGYARCRYIFSYFCDCYFATKSLPKALKTEAPEPSDFSQNNHSFLIYFTYNEVIENLKSYKDPITLHSDKYTIDDITLDKPYRDIGESLKVLMLYDILEKQEFEKLPNIEYTFKFLVKPINEKEKTNKLPDYTKETNLAKFDYKWFSDISNSRKKGKNNKQDSIPNQRIEFDMPPGSNIFAPRRKTPLATIKKELEKHQLLVITGIKGFGKTETAIKYYCEYRELYPGGIFWIDARANLSLKFRSFIRKLLNLSHTKNDRDDQDFEFQASDCWNYWRQLNKGKKLIIVDDVLNFNDIRNYLPDLKIYSEFHVVLTSPRNLYVGKELKLSPLHWEESMNLIYEHFELANSDTSRLDNASKRDKEELCKILMNCPLIIHLIAIYLIRYDRLSLEDLTSRFRKQGIKHSSLSIDQSSSAIRYQHETLEIALTFIYDVLTEDAQRLGCLMGMLSYSPINLDLFDNIKIDDLTTDKEKLEGIIAELIENHLLPKRDSNGTYRSFELIHSFFREKLHERIENNDTLIKENVRMLVNDVVEISKRIVLEHESSEDGYFDLEAYRFHMAHIAEIGINNLEQVSQENAIYPLISYLIVYNDGMSSGTSRIDDSNQQLPAPIKLFRSLIQRLCEIDEPTNIIFECFDRLFFFYDFQQYLYDTEYLQTSIKEFEQLREKVISWDYHPKAEATFLKLLGHGLYAYSESEKQKNSVRHLVKVAEIAETERQREVISDKEQRMWNLFLLAMLDHTSHTMFKAGDDIDTESVVFDTYSRMIDSLNSTYESVDLTFLLSQLPSPRATPYVLQAAHYQGHLAIQCLITLFTSINTYLNSSYVATNEDIDPKIQIEQIYHRCIEYYRSGIHLRIIDLYKTFPGVRLVSLEKEFPQSIRKLDSYSEWISHVIEDNHRFKDRHFTNISQLIGDIGNQYRGITTARLWYCLFIIKCGESGANRILNEATYSLGRSRRYWKIAQKKLHGEMLIKYYLRMVSTKQMYTMLKSYITDNSLLNLNDLRRNARSEFDDIEKTYGLSDSNIQDDSLKKIRLFHNLLSMNFINN